MNHDLPTSEPARSTGGLDVADLPLPHTPLRRSASGRLLRLCLKELREILRDRRTIVTLALMPLLVYPLLSILFNKLLSTPDAGKASYDYIVGLEARKEDEELFRAYLAKAEDIWNGNKRPADAIAGKSQEKEKGGAPSGPLTDPGGPKIQLWTGSNIERLVASGDLDVGILVTRPMLPGASRPGRTLRAELLYREYSALSKQGLDHVERRLSAYNEQFLLERLRRLGMNPSLPLTQEVRAIRDVRPAFSLTTLIPLILILMTITGAVYPAIDLTAGERERGTLEALMAAPVPRLMLLTAKYVAVVTVALLTALANLLAMTITLMSTGLGEAVFGPAGLPPVLMLEVFGLLVLFAAFFSAILLAITSFARSFKEAQAYLIPLMLLSLAPGTISLMPNLEFSRLFSVVPLVNIVLLARDLMEGRVDLTLAMVAVASTAIYAVAAIALAARIFGTDAILYGSQASWSDLLRPRKSPRAAPSVSGAMLSLALLFPLYFLLANGLQRIGGLSISTKLILSAVVTVLLFALLPLIAAAAQGVRYRDAFRAKFTGPLPLLAAVWLGLSLWPLAHELFLVNRQLGIDTLSAEQIERAQKLLENLRRISPALVLAALALTPAVCEELFFRGYLFASLRTRFSAAGAVIWTAVLFGVFHVVVTSGLSVERMLPSTFLGLVLGWVCYRTGSVWPGVVLHATHNGLLLMMGIYHKLLLPASWHFSEQEHLPRTWVAVSALSTLLAAVFMFTLTRRRRSTVTETVAIEPNRGGE